MGRESGHRTRTETGGRDLGCISVQKQDQKLVVGIWNAFRARGPKTFPGNRSVFFWAHSIPDGVLHFISGFLGCGNWAVSASRNFAEKPIFFRGRFL